MRLNTLILTALLPLAPAAPEVHTMTLRQAVDRALSQNPEVIIARLGEQSAGEQVRVVRDAFIPKTYAGSGLAQTWGFPTTVDSEAPSIAQVRTVATLFNRPLTHRLAKVKQDAEAAKSGTAATRRVIALRTVELYLEAERAAKSAKLVREQVDGLEKVVAVMRLRVDEGRELPVALTRAELDVARAGQRLEVHQSDLEFVENQLASVLGFDAGDRVRVAGEQHPLPDLPNGPEEAVEQALAGSEEVRRLQASLKGSEFAIRAERAERLPQVNLIGKYNLLARFNNFEEFFNRFQRHNGQIGLSVEIPLYRTPGEKARISQATLDSERLRAELTSKRNEIALETRRSYLELRQARTGAKVSRLELDLAREELSVVLARMEEGRASLKEVEAARFVENERWIAFYDAQHHLALARYQLLDRTGALLAALQ